MDLFGGPAMLGGVMTCIALGAWLLGRWQGGFTPGPDEPDRAALLLQTERDAAAPGSGPATATPCRQAARAERCGALEAPASLGDLHAEVSAYRRAQQVLADIGRDQLDAVLVTSREERECLYMRASGHPACPMPRAPQQGSGCGPVCAAPDQPPPQRVVQPSPVVSDFTRV